MAAVTRVKAYPCMPPGYEVVSTAATVSEAVQAGDLLILNTSGMWQRSGAATPAVKRGFAAQDYKQGQSNCSILFHGEMDGWSGLQPGVPLYPGVTGGLDDAAVAGFTGLIHALSATRIGFTL